MIIFVPENNNKTYKDMKKVITFIRTSTLQQEVESQLLDNINYLKSLGYDKDEILVIGEAGASAIKLDDQYIKNLEKVYAEIESNPSIELVFAWAIDRIGRDEEVLMKFKNTLIKKRIQLKIKEPELYLLDHNGNVNKGMEIAFSLFATMAKQEMEMKKARFERAKKHYKKQGRFIGGKVRYGFYPDKNKHIQVNEEQATVVREIVNLYLTTNLSQAQLYKELVQRGLHFKYSAVRHILNDKVYYGLDETLPYPAILPAEWYDKVIAKNNSNNLNTDKATRKWYLGAKLVVCPHCGKKMMAHVGSGAYLCRNSLMKVSNTTCDYNKYTNINAIDSIAWHYAKFLHKLFITTKAKEQQEQMQLQLEILHQKLNVANEEKATYTEKIERLAVHNAVGRLSDKSFEKQIAILETEQLANDELIATLKSEIQHTQELITTATNTDSESEAIWRIAQANVVLNEMNYKEMYDIVHKYIKAIHIVEVEVDIPDKGITQCKKIVCENYFGVELKFADVYFNPTVKRAKDKKFFHLTKNGVRYLPNILYLERSHRYKKLKERRARKAKQQAEE